MALQCFGLCESGLESRARATKASRNNERFRAYERFDLGRHDVPIEL